MTTTKHSSPFISNLIATYEEVFAIPEKQRITFYFGNYGSHYFKINATETIIQAAYEKALEALGLTEEEFKAKESTYMYRANIRNDMCARLYKKTGGSS